MSERVFLGDIHGCYKTMMATLDKVEKKWPGVQVGFCGDLIDRGKDSAKVIKFVKDGGYPCVRGNHEDIMLNHYHRVKRYWSGCWTSNGGRDCMSSYGGDVPREDLDWVESLPLWLDYPDVVDKNGRGLFVSHSCFEPANLSEKIDFDSTKFNKHTTLKDEDLTQIVSEVESSVLWYRGTPAKVKDRFHIYGHTPVKYPDITEYSANIDTGCVYGHRGYGTMTALHYPSLEYITQENIEDK